MRLCLSAPKWAVSFCLVCSFLFQVGSGFHRCLLEGLSADQGRSSPRAVSYVIPAQLLWVSWISSPSSPKLFGMCPYGERKDQCFRCKEEHWEVRFYEHTIPCQVGGGSGCTGWWVGCLFVLSVGWGPRWISSIGTRRDGRPDFVRCHLFTKLVALIRGSWLTIDVFFPLFGKPYSLLALSNNTCFQHTLDHIAQRFDRLYKRKVSTSEPSH